MIHLTRITRKYRNNLADVRKATTRRLKDELIEDALSREQSLDRKKERLREREHWWAALG